MPTLQTARHKMPFLAVSQAQKEITHNEALVIIDALLHPVVQSQLSTPPTVTDADIGKCWLIGASPIAEWSGKTDHIAVWIGGGWRYLSVGDGTHVRRADTNVELVKSEGQWNSPPAIADPATGSVVDVEARQAIATLLSYFRTIGQIAS